MGRTGFGHIHSSSGVKQRSVFIAFVLGVSCGCVPLLRTSADPPPPEIGPSVEPGGGSFDSASELASVMQSEQLSVLDGVTLSELQRVARLRSPRVDALHARFEAADARVRQALSEYYPQLRSDGTYLRLDEEVAFPNPGPGGGSIVVQDRDAYTQVTSLNYQLWDWGATRSRYRAGLRDRDRQTAENARDLQLLDVQVANAVYSIREAEQDLEVVGASVETLRGAFEDAKALRDAGFGTEADVLVIQVQLERARFSGRRLQDAVRSARDELGSLLGDGRMTELELSVDSSSLPASGERYAAIAEHLQGIALAKRPEFEALRAASTSLEEVIRSERSTYLPTFDLFVQHEYSTTDSAFRDPQFFSGGVNARWELFSGFRTRARISELEARVRELRASTATLELDLEVEIRRALRRYRRALDGIEVARVSVVRATENLRQVKARFDSEKATGQELLEAESLLRSERARSVRSRFSAFRSWAALRFACGLDYQDELDLSVVDRGEDSGPEEDEFGEEEEDDAGTE